MLSSFHVYSRGWTKVTSLEEKSFTNYDIFLALEIVFENGYLFILFVLPQCGLFIVNIDLNQRKPSAL